MAPLGGDGICSIVRGDGGNFLVPFVSGSWRGSEVVMIVGSCDAVGLFIDEYLLVDEFGTLKLGAPRDRFGNGFAGGPPYVEWRKFFG